MNIGKKINKNGFTLVELVVVMSIFGAILAAILNFMRPANEIHNDTQATMDANVISSGLIEYVDDELRYATNVLVLQDYPGVPEVSNSGLVGTYSVAFSDCLIIDNTNPRGYTTSDYDPNRDDPATKFGARGSIIKVTNIDTDGLNFNNSRVVKGLDFYDKFSFNIKAGTNVLDENFKDDNSLSTLQLSLVAYYPVYENGRFVFTKKKFDRDTKNGDGGTIEKNRGAVINLTNINIDSGDSSVLKAAYNPSNSPAETSALFEADGFPRATMAHLGANAQQQSMYDAFRTVNITDYEGVDVTATPAYTYIFYKKQKSATKCAVNFKFSKNSPITPEGDVAPGYTDVVKGTLFKNFPSTPAAPSGYNPPYWQAPDGSKVDPSVGYTITGDTTFVLVYTEKAPSPNEVTITWLMPDGNSAYAITRQDKSTGTEFVKAIEPPLGAPLDPAHYDYRWVQLGTGKSVDEVSVDGPLTFIALAEKKPTVKFSTDGTNTDSEIVVSKGEVVPNHMIPDPVADKVPSGKMFDKWVVKDHDDQDIVSTVINGDTTFVAKFKDKPPVPAGATVVKIHVISLHPWNGNLASITSTAGEADFSISGAVNIARHQKNYYSGDILVNQIQPGKDYEITFYSDNLSITFQWAGSRTFNNTGLVYELWYKEGQFYDSNPG